MKYLIVALLLGLASKAASGAVPEVDVYGHLAEMEQGLIHEHRELEALREEARRERHEFGRELSRVEDDVFALRRELNALQAERSLAEERAKEPLAESRRARKSIDYLRTSLRDFAVYFQATVHLAEWERFEPTFAALHAGGGGETNGPATGGRTRLELWGDVVEAAVGHCESLNGGRLVAGRAVAGPEVGEVEGHFALWGPLTLFGSDDGRVGGYVTVPPNSLEHHVIETGAANNAAIAHFVQAGTGDLPIDAAEGNAALLYATRDPLPEHIAKGGPVMAGILALGASALFVALFKMVQVARVRRVAMADVNAILAHLREGDEWEAMEIANRLKGPEGAVFRVGVSHYHEDSEELQLALVNTVADAHARLKAGAPFIAVAAAMAPLFGLLGTVTGMINTFRLISVYGTGDPRMLSSGISESLITTEFGLVIAVPSLLLHAAVAGRIKQLVQSMESKAMRFLVNRLSAGPPDEADAGGEPNLKSNIADQELDSPNRLNRATMQSDG